MSTASRRRSAGPLESGAIPEGRVAEVIARQERLAVKRAEEVAANATFRDQMPAAPVESAYTAKEIEVIDQADLSLKTGSKARRREGRKTLADIEARVTEERERRTVQAGIDETVALERMRGEPVRYADVAGASPGERASQLEMLASRGDLGDGDVRKRRLEAGEHFGTAWRRVHNRKRSLRSCLDDGARSSLNAPALSPGEAAMLRVKQADALAAAGKAIGEYRIVSVLEAVCGRDESLHAMAYSDTRARRRLLALLLQGLDALVPHYRLA